MLNIRIAAIVEYFIVIGIIKEDSIIMIRIKGIIEYFIGIALIKVNAIPRIAFDGGFHDCIFVRPFNI
jgi:hypothetical protein